MKPFFINSNICIESNDISSFEVFMKAIAGNTGNSYITYALIKELMGGLSKIRHIQNIYEYNFDNQDVDIDYINNEATHVFLILQDQIRIAESYGFKLPYRQIMNFISKLNKPVIIAGLGANSFNGFDSKFHEKLDPELIIFLKFLSDHCIEIGLRGTFTQEVLHNIGVDNTRVIGCPSYFEMGPNRIIKKESFSDIKSIVLTSRMPHIPLNTDMLMQDFQEETLIKPIAFDRVENILTDFEVRRLFEQKYHLFSNIEDWKNFIKNFKFAIGVRLHGTILALNAGVPALCLNIDSRATEMCDFLKIPHNTSLKIENIEDYFRAFESIDIETLNINYPKLYENFANFIHKNNLLLFSENKDSFSNIEYIQQPSLKLYSNDFYKELSNKVYLKILIESMMKKKKDNLSFLQKIFSVKNEGLYKVWRILFFKFKYRI